MSRIVFDIGGTNMRAASVEGEAPSKILTVKTPQEPGTAFETFAALIGKAAKGEKVAALAGGAPGVISAEGVILDSPNLPLWGSFPLRARLEERFGAAVEVKNDADLAGLGEALRGAGRGFSIVAYLGIGTGVGGTRIVDGRVDRHAIGFEPGQSIVDAPRGASLESLIGGAALAKKHGAAVEKLSRSIVDELTPVLAAGVWNAIVHWSPDIVILGGSLMNDETGFRIADVARELKRARVVFPSLPPVARSALGEVAGLYGAAALLATV